MGAFIVNFGKNKDGLNLYRINGTKEEIEDAIEKLSALGIELSEPYEFEKAHMQSSVLVKMKMPFPEPESFISRTTPETAPEGQESLSERN
jgi:hypothetical protein